MSGDRYVLAGLARPRSEWFRAVAQWATSAAIPAEFAKCVSVEELRARLTGRTFSAALLEGGLPGVDRDLLDTIRAAGCVVFVIDDGRRSNEWKALGAAAVLPPPLTRETLLDALATSAAMVGRMSADILDVGTGAIEIPFGRGAVAAVCGPGGTGVSTAAAALAQGLGAAGPSGGVLLADFALNAEQAMLHDVRDVVPGVQELVESHRSGRPSREEVVALTFDVVERQYHLLLGLRRARYWSTIRRRSFEAAFDSLRRCYDVTVCDVTADLEGEAEGGSADVEERNLMARTAVAEADVVFVVGRPSVKGMHALVRVMVDVASLGVPTGRVVPVVTMASKQPRWRAEIAGALTELVGPVMGGSQSASPVFLPVRRVDEATRDGVALPAPLPAILAGAFNAVLTRLEPLRTSPDDRARPTLVVPGELGGWFDEDAG